MLVMNKGQITRENILKAACEFSSKFGFEALSIGKLAQNVGLSKSGLFGHFKSKEKLQEMVLYYTAENFTLSVLKPAVKKPRGIARLDAILENWIKWTKSQSGGCPLLTAAIEFDDRPGEIQKVVKELYSKQIAFYAKAIEIAVEESEFPADTDIKQFTYEFYSLLVGQHIYARLLKDKTSSSQLRQAYQELKSKYQNFS